MFYLKNTGASYVNTERNKHDAIKLYGIRNVYKFVVVFGRL